MKKESKIFGKNFLKIQEPPTFIVKSRLDGATMIVPPSVEFPGGITMVTTHTNSGSITKSGTDTYQGTSTNVNTSTQTNNMLHLEGENNLFGIISSQAEKIKVVKQEEIKYTKLEDFQITNHHNSVKIDDDYNTKINSNLNINEVEIIEQRLPDFSNPGSFDFTLPARNNPIGGLVNSSDSDSDDEGDEDDNSDSDNDNDADDEGDTDDREDLYDKVSFETFQKSLKVKLPLSGDDQKGRMG